MLHFVNGDIFKSKAMAIVNPVNTVGVMGKGLALEFKQRYPSMFRKYKQICDANKLGVGILHYYQEEDYLIINFPTKLHWRDASQLEYVERGLRNFVKNYRKRGVTSVAFPPLGCGLGGLRWEDVRSLMIKYLGDLPIDVYIYGEGPKEEKKMDEFRVIVAGGRDFDDYELLKSNLDSALRNIRKRKDVIIVSGAARGADSLGERYAKEEGLRLESFPANWKEHGNKAGPIRNIEMAKVANALVAFWDQKSRGTDHMIRVAKRMDLKVRIINY